MMRTHEEFEVETDEPGEPPLSFWTETVRGVMVEKGRLWLGSSQVRLSALASPSSLERVISSDGQGTDEREGIRYV